MNSYDDQFQLLRKIAVSTLARAEDLDAQPLEVALDDGHIEQNGEYFFITRKGEGALDALYRERVPPSEREHAIELLDAFSVLDPELKRIAQSWQVREDGNRNAHDDKAYDDAVRAELAALDDEVQNLLRRQTGALAGIAEPFAQELATARKAIEAGSGTHFTSTSDQSYHSVWFRLHEELLRTVGRQRSE